MAQTRGTVTPAHGDPSQEGVPGAATDVEVFHNTCDIHVGGMRSGWYWWPIRPDEMPTKPPTGPYSSRAMALSGAQRAWQASRRTLPLN